MNSKVSEADVLNLLDSLKNAESNYPKEMIASRRGAYIKQAAAMGLLINAGKNGTQAASSTAATGNVAAPAIGKVLEIVLAIAILVEAGVVTYLYRQQISEWINDLISPRIEQGVNPSDDSASPFTSTSETNTETATAIPTDTPVVTVTVTDGTTAPSAGSNDNNSINGQVEATPAPQDNPGNHYGNTPKPDRTKEPPPENNNNNNGNSNNNGNKK